MRFSRSAFPLLALAITCLVARPFPAHAQGSRLPSVSEAVRTEADLPYADTENPRQRLDFHAPKSQRRGKDLPLVVFIHGGAFLYGDRKPEPPPGDSGGVNLMLSMVASGDYVGASIGYRMSTEAQWPAQIHDCKAAIRWLRARARKLGIDPNRIGVMGTSAGGHLAALLGTSGQERALEGELGKHLKTSSEVTCVVDQYGPTDFLALHGEENRDPGTPAAKLFGGPVPDRRDAAREASPLTYAKAGGPPFLILHGTRDPIVSFNQSELLAAALEKAGSPVTFVHVINGGHGGFSSPEVPRRIVAFFDKHLRDRDTPVSGAAIE